MKRWLLQPYRHLLDFKGRSPRRELAIFILTHSIVLLCVGAAINAAENEASQPNQAIGFLVLYFFGVVLLSLPILVRRLHDADRSAWWLLTWFFPVIGGLFLLVLLCANGNEGENRFGPDPRSFDTSDAEVFT
ncbi:MAG: DUF805 domain-containing protein [Novosphingobium sp.]